MFRAALFIIVKVWEQSECPLIDKWLKGCSVCINNEILLGHKKEWNNAICNDMNKPRYCHTKLSKSEREKTNTIQYHLYVESTIWYK